jgi:MFS family permease
MVMPILPELRDGLDTSLSVAAASLTVYLLPFAAFMLVSGTLAERWGRRRTVQIAYVGYAAASLLCALAPQAPLFLAGRALQGVANAFTTPILMAALAEVTNPQRLGRALGLFGSVQAAGLSFAPVIGGLLAIVNWRLGFVVTLVAALALSTQPPPEAVGSAADGRRAGGWRSLANSRLSFACLVAALAYFTSVGINSLGALLAADRFGLPPGSRGLVVASFGAAGLVAGGLVGRQLDRFGVRRFGVLGCVSLGTGAVVAGVSPTLVVLIGALALSGIAGLACRVVVNSMAVRSSPINRGGAASLMLACQFLGGALAPIVLIPVYRQGATTGLAVAAISSVVAAGLLLVVPERWVSLDL